MELLRFLFSPAEGCGLHLISLRPLLVVRVVECGFSLMFCFFSLVFLTVPFVEMSRTVDLK